jgi:hypothetical protein
VFVGSERSPRYVPAMTPPHAARGRSRLIRSVLLLLAPAALGAQQGPADSTLGTVLRIRTVRGGMSGTQPRRSAGEGLLIRSRGVLQRVDVLRAIDDSVGSEWIRIGPPPREMRIHSVAQRSTLVMKYEDLQTVFTSVMQTRFDSASAEAEVLGPGPTLLGHSTQRVLFRRALRIQSTRGGKTQVTRVRSEIDALIAPDLPESLGANSALSLTSGSASDLIDQIFGAGASQVIVKGGAILPSGLALRTVSRSVTTSTGAQVMPFSTGRDSSATTDSVEVMSIARAPLSDALFAEPVGYEVVDFGQQMSKLITMMDSMGTSLDALGKGSKPPKPYTAPKPTSKPYKP